MVTTKDRLMLQDQCMDTYLKDRGEYVGTWGNFRLILWSDRLAVTEMVAVDIHGDEIPPLEVDRPGAIRALRNYALTHPSMLARLFERSKDLTFDSIVIGVVDDGSYKIRHLVGAARFDDLVED